MKKSTLKVLALALVAVVVCITMVACAKTLNATYTYEINVAGVSSAKTTYEFSGKKVTLTVSSETIGVPATSTTLTGTYKIKGDTITFDFDEDTTGAYSVAVPFEETDNGIKIAGVEYTKQ